MSRWEAEHALQEVKEERQDGGGRGGRNVYNSRKAGMLLRVVSTREEAGTRGGGKAIKKYQVPGITVTGEVGGAPKRDMLRAAGRIA